MASSAHDNQKTNSTKRSLQDRTRLERLSFGLSLDNEEHAATDHTHRYSHIKRYDIVDSQRGIYTSHRWLALENISNEPSEYVTHMETGETKAHFSELQLQAWNPTNTNTPLRIEPLVATQPSFVQTCQIWFNKPLLPGERTTVHYQLSWPGEPLAYSPNEHSQSIALLRYRGGVEKLDFGLLELRPIAKVRCVQISENFEEPIYKIDVQEFLAEDDLDLQPFHDKGYKGFKYSITPQQSSAFRFLYNFK